ncbi:MAG TPA: hypothetical protein P5548_03605 [Candidatus Moranbacteria bacterium]|nr:hypothetical protein [Candidatus Moranbacteria bacterium]
MMKNNILLLSIIWLIVVNAAGLLAVNRLNLKADDAYSWISAERYNQHKSWNIINIHSRWDSNWYINLIENGYERKADDTLSNLVFLPLYPLLVKIISMFSLGNIAFAGWIVSSIFLVLSCMLMAKMIREFHKESDPLFSVFLLLIFPTAFFLNAVYTESLFLFLSLGAFYFTFKKKYFLAGIIGFLASLTRVTGILIFLPLVVQVLINEGINLQGLKKSLPLLLIPTGLLLFFAYHWVFFGDPLLFFKIENAWGRSFTFNKDHFVFLSNASLSNFYLDIIYSIFSLGVSLYLLKIKKYPYAIYMASTILVAFATGTLMSIGRYILILFPIYILGGSIKSEILKYSWIIVSAMLMAMNTYLFVNWYWAG